MNPLKYIQKNWDFKKSTKQNAIYFNTRKEKEKNIRSKLILLSLFIIGASLLFHNPALAFLILIGAITYGSEYIFNNAITYAISICALDATNFVIVYCDYDDTGKGKAIKGTVSGTTISYGSEYTFDASITYAGVDATSCDAIDSTHFVVAYYYNAGSSPFSGKALIGTISGTAINYGTAYTFNSTTPTNVSVTVLDSTHIAIAYNNQYSTPDYPSKAIIGVISSVNVITFGTEYTFVNQISSGIKISAIDSTHFVVAFKYNYNGTSSSAIGTIIGTVASGDDISFGDIYVAKNSNTGPLRIVVLDSTHFVIAYSDENASYYATAIIGTVASVNQISFGTPVVANNKRVNSISVDKIDATNFLIAYDANSTDFGRAVIGTVSAGNTITFGNLYTFNNDYTSAVGCAILSSSVAVIGFYDAADGEKGKAIIGTFSSAYTKTITEVVKVVPVLSKLFPKILSQIISIVPRFTKLPNKKLSQIVSVIPNLKKYPGRKLSQFLKIVSALVKRPGKTLTQTIRVMPTLIKVSSRVLTQIVKVVPVLLKQGAKILSDRIVPRTIMIYQVSRALIERIIVVPVLSKIATLKKTLTEIIKVSISSLSNVLTAVRTLAEQIKVNSSILKQISKTLLEVILAIEKPITAAFIFLKVLVEQIIIAGNLVGMVIARTLTETIKIILIFLNQSSKVFSETIRVVVIFEKIIVKTFLETVQIISSIVSQSSKIFFETIQVISTSINVSLKTFVEIVLVNGAFSRLFITSFSEAIKVVGTMLKQSGKIFTSSLNVGDSFNTLRVRMLSEMIKVRGILVKSFSRIFSEIIKITSTFKNQAELIFSEVITVIGTLKPFNVAKVFIERVVIGWAKIKLVLNGIQVGLWAKIPRITGTWGPVARIKGTWKKISRNDN